MIDDDTFRELMRKMDSGVYILDLEKRIKFWNPAAERLTGYSSGRAMGCRCSDNLLRHITPDGVNLCLSGCPMAVTMSDLVVREAEVYMHRSDGSRQPVVVVAAPLTDASGAVVGAVEVFSDMRDRSLLLSEIEALRHEALSDPLTGLGNRRFLDIAAEARFEALEHGGAEFGLFMADIDNFKLVNDEYGHDMGDRVLKMVASTLSAVVRPLDAAVRWGGEEFVLLCPNISADALGGVAERIRMAVEQSWLELEGGKILGVTISVGAVTGRRGDTIHSVVARADRLLYEAKNAGRNRCSVGD